MKKVIALILICMMLASTAACTCFRKIESQLGEIVRPSETESTDDAEPAQKPSESPDSAKTTEASAQEPSEEPEGDTATPEPAEEPKHTTYTVDNAVIADNDYCKVTLISGTESASGDVAFKFLLENKTADKEQTFSIDDVAVNGWIVSSGVYESVKAGKKANDTMTLTASDMKEYGLTSADKLAFSLRVYDSNDWSADNFVDDTFTVYPTGMTEAEVVSPERQKTAKEMVVVDNDKCAFVILDTYEDSIWGYTLSVYLENKSADKSMMFSWDDVSVNGFMIDPFWASSIPAGSKKLSQISFDESKFADNGIKDVGEIEFELRVYDNDDWGADDFVRDIFTYRPGSAAAEVQTTQPTEKPSTETSGYTNADVVGTWTLTSAKAMGMTLPASSLGLEMSFTFNADGSASMYYDNETTEGLTWKLEGNLIKLGAYGIDLYDFVFDGKTLTLHEDDNDVDMIFEKN
ncbi:MAG: lipocalin family protein [Clostridia bacterium]|nr:lipocalin family protein [Clostridia bacterium]